MDPMEKEAAQGSMEKEAGSEAAPPRRNKDWTPEERKAANEFLTAAIADYHVYAAMTEEDIEEEYRRAGKLHKYDAETELQKRCARVAKKHPPPAGFFPALEKYFKLFQDDDH